MFNLRAHLQSHRPVSGGLVNKVYLQPNHFESQWELREQSSTRSSMRDRRTAKATMSSMAREINCGGHAWHCVIVNNAICSIYVAIVER